MNSGVRAACDRCHGQKMKCIRDKALKKCNRCQASRAECTFSPARKSGRPPTAHRDPVSPLSMAPNRLDGNQQATPHKTNIYPTPASHNSRFDSTVMEESEMSLLPFQSSLDSNISGLEAWNDDFFTAEAQLDSHDAVSGTLTPYSENYLPAFDQSPHGLDSGLGCGEATRALSVPFSPNGRSSEEVSAALDTTRQLSELSGRLFTQVNCHTRRNKNNPSHASTDYFERLVADVLDSSVAFLNILKAFQKAVVKITQDITGPFTSEDDSGNFVPDTATTLQILTAYIRLTQLHHALYTHIQSLLSPSTSATNCPTIMPKLPLLTIFPSLSIGGITLSAYPRFQFKFLLQICAHHLGEIEALLSLPSGFRVSAMERCAGSAGNSNGILGSGSGGTALLVRTILMEVEEPMKDIRTILAFLREELRGSIQI
ncbi:hypothetical protein K505DRAFT_336579 [Melanomma pulvis-pyrius CBS 109.77]|uniref:Zn(2)-C6 fungal-type domain-containing protein n=1 Tax=Melanomma pulvis-pyrius CBS 109.77 TaxID=1314802 RepID=A0A6A6XEV4_9PLEO|nr:hypothetical protein K505DRAFT_336579 [Melanomma pulvis-pyrius CBS 109.77]